LKYYVKNCYFVIQNQIINSSRKILSCGTIEIKNTTISSGVTVNIHAQESVTIKPGFHAVAGSNVRIVAERHIRANSSPDNSLPLDNDDTKSFSLSEELTVATIETTGVDFSVFPNPNDGNFTVKIEGELQPYTIEIFNNLGGQMDFVNCNQDFVNINRTDLNAGIYFVKITMNGKIAVKKIIVR
jgi:hypothetical protein